MRLYCTYFDDGYLSRGTVMIESLLQHDSKAEVWVLALTPRVARELNDRFGESITVVPLPVLESCEPVLLRLKRERSALEYIFTLTAPWTRYVMQQAGDRGGWVTYLDADLFFFSSTEPVFSEIEPASVAIVEHRYPATRRGLSKYGTYNVGWVGFRNDEEGGRCLDWWAQACLQWCYDRVDEGRFADQGYLDQFTQHTDSLVVVSNPGVDLAPWNLGRHRVRTSAYGPLVDGHPVVCFHFHGVWKRGDRYFWKNSNYHAVTTRTIRESLFRPYLQALAAVEEDYGAGFVDSRQRGLLPRFKTALKTAIARIVGDTLALRNDD